MKGVDQLVVCVDRMVGPGLLQRRCSKRRAESDNVASGPPGGGIDDPYEAPDKPELTLKSDEQTLEQELDQYLETF